VGGEKGTGKKVEAEVKVVKVKVEAEVKVVKVKVEAEVQVVKVSDLPLPLGDVMARMSGKP